MNTKQILMIAAVLMIAVFVVPVIAQDTGCIVPPDEYFVKDAPHLNGQPVHEGIQNGFVFWIPFDNRISGVHLGIPHGGYKLKQSHNDQEKILMGKLMYCGSIPDHPYEAPETFTSENPSTSIYTPAHASAIFR